MRDQKREVTTQSERARGAALGGAKATAVVPPEKGAIKGPKKKALSTIKCGDCLPQTRPSDNPVVSFALGARKFFDNLAEI